MKKTIIALGAAILMLSASLTACMGNNTPDAKTNEPTIADGSLGEGNIIMGNNNPDAQTNESTIEEALVYPFETDYFDQITEAYKNTPDLLSAIETPPTILTISGSYTGFMITANPLNVETALTNVKNTLTEAGYVQVTDLSAKLDFSSNVQNSDIVYYREHDKTFISVAINGDDFVIRYAVNDYYGSPNDNFTDNSSYKSSLFDSSYYDVAIELYKDDVPSPDEPLKTPPYRIDIEGAYNRLTYYYLIDNPDARIESFNMTLEAAGFQKDGLQYTNGSVKISIELEPDQSGFTNAIVKIARV
jgi:hypothetical protein